MMSSLTARGVSVQLGGLRILRDINLRLDSDEVVGLIGPNGAGKTTLVNILSGFQKPTSGAISIDGRDVSRLSVQARAKLGLVRTFQAVRLFGRLTVFDNVYAGALANGASNREARNWTNEILSWLSLESVAHLASATLPYGLERRVGLARAIALRPRFLLLDEPAAGLNEEEAGELLTTIESIRRKLSCGVLLIEHNMDFVFRLCSRVQVLRAGATLLVGTPAEVRRHPEVRAAYLGEAG